MPHTAYVRDASGARFHPALHGAIRSQGGQPNMTNKAAGFLTHSPRSNDRAHDTTIDTQRGAVGGGRFLGTNINNHIGHFLNGSEALDE